MYFLIVRSLELLPYGAKSRDFSCFMISRQISVKDLICLSFLYPPASKLLYFPYKEYHSSVSSQETTTINTFFIEKCGSVGSSSQHREMMIWKHFVPRNVLSQWFNTLSTSLVLFRYIFSHTVSERRGREKKYKMCIISSCNAALCAQECLMFTCTIIVRSINYLAVITKAVDERFWLIYSAQLRRAISRAWMLALALSFCCWFYCV